MPDNTFPGVFVEETPFKSRSIEGVSTSSAGFVGPTRFGPIDARPHVVTNLSEFERVYGIGQQLEFEAAGHIHNYQWHAARAFFEEGGKRLYVARIFRPLPIGSISNPPNSEAVYHRPGEKISESDSSKVGDFFSDGHARCWITRDLDGQRESNSILIRARFPGALERHRGRGEPRELPR